GLWEIFLPALQPGDLYKFEIKGRHGFLAQKADPYAFFSELRPRSASVVWNIHRYRWNDRDWMDRRRRADWHGAPISVYEVHPGSWRRVPEEGNRMLTYREMAD
ncbi:1,4-alpha-glucan branching enzyme, partial [Arthrospira platensis SPKY1]|nr:1,4-alpha-glucan branching enzyme [Arthrospira platensis SPKY1]